MPAPVKWISGHTKTYFEQDFAGDTCCTREWWNWSWKCVLNIICEARLASKFQNIMIVFITQCQTNASTWTVVRCGSISTYFLVHWSKFNFQFSNCLYFRIFFDLDISDKILDIRGWFRSQPASHIYHFMFNFWTCYCCMSWTWHWFWLWMLWLRLIWLMCRGGMMEDT